jgi:hypothetical protein
MVARGMRVHSVMMCAALLALAACTSASHRRPAEPVPAALSEHQSDVTTMRLVGPAGPLAGARYAAEVEMDSDHVVFLGRGVTDRHGSLSIEEYAVGTIHVLVWERDDILPSLEGVSRAGYVETRPAVHDLGDIFLREAPTLVSGTVTSQDGTPFAGVPVTVHLWVEGMCGHGLPGPGPFYYYFGSLRRFSTQTDLNGQFMLRGSSTFTSMRTSHLALGLQKPGYTCEHGPSDASFIVPGRIVHLVLVPGTDWSEPSDASGTNR